LPLTKCDADEQGTKGGKKIHRNTALGGSALSGNTLYEGSGVNMTPLKIKKKVIAKSVIYHFLHTFLIVY